MRVSCGAGLALTWRGAAPCVRSRSRPSTRRPAPSCAGATTRPTTPRTARATRWSGWPTPASTRPRSPSSCCAARRTVRRVLHRFRDGGLDAVPRRTAPGPSAPSRPPGRPSCCASSSWTRTTVGVPSANWTTGLLAAYLAEQHRHRRQRRDGARSTCTPTTTSASARPGRSQRRAGEQDGLPGKRLRVEVLLAGALDPAPPPLAGPGRAGPAAGAAGRCRVIAGAPAAGRPLPPGRGPGRPPPDPDPGLVPQGPARPAPGRGAGPEREGLRLRAGGLARRLVRRPAGAGADGGGLLRPGPGGGGALAGARPGGDRAVRQPAAPTRRPARSWCGSCWRSWRGELQVVYTPAYDPDANRIEWLWRRVAAGGHPQPSAPGLRGAVRRRRGPLPRPGRPSGRGAGPYRQSWLPRAG